MVVMHFRSCQIQQIISLIICILMLLLVSAHLIGCLERIRPVVITASSTKRNQIRARERSQQTLQTNDHHVEVENIGLVARGKVENFFRR